MPPPAENSRCLADGCRLPMMDAGIFCRKHLDGLPAFLRKASRFAAASVQGLEASRSATLKALASHANRHFDRAVPFWVADVKDPDCPPVVWVGRAWRDHPAHPLANPVVLTQAATPAEKAVAVAAYSAWLDGLCSLTAELGALWAACDSGAKPLGCGCGQWLPGDPPIVCHAHVLAVRLNLLHLGG